MLEPTARPSPDGSSSLPATPASGLEPTGPATLSQVMLQVEQWMASGDVVRYRPLPLGFDPLDDVLNGGLRRGDLLVLGGAFGVGKTIFALQTARNVVRNNKGSRAMYICYEHERDHMLDRLLCLESGEQNSWDDALTLRKLAKMTTSAGGGSGLITHLQQMPRYRGIVDAMLQYGERLILVKASGDHSSLDVVRHWIESAAAEDESPLLVVVDYLQKIPVRQGNLQSEDDVTTYLTQGLKEIAMTLGIQILAVAASDRTGLKARRMQLSDLRGSSALQYEADIGLVLNNKWSIVSRQHVIFNPEQAQAMRDWVVLTVEKNRSGRSAVDMEFALDAAHFRFRTDGRFVRERLVDDKVALE